MQGTVVIVVEGVLRAPVAGAPILQGKLLYYGLASMMSVVLFSRETPKEELDQFLMLENMNLHAHVVYPDKPYSWLTARSKMAQLRRQYSVEMVIDADTPACAELLEDGFNVLHFLHAEYAVPSWRPDYEFKVRPWDSLAAQIAKNAELRSRDSRLGSDPD